MELSDFTQHICHAPWLHALLPSAGFAGAMLAFLAGVILLIRPASRRVIIGGVVIVVIGAAAGITCGISLSVISSNEWTATGKSFDKQLQEHYGVTTETSVRRIVENIRESGTSEAVISTDEGHQRATFAVAGDTLVLLGADGREIPALK